MKTKFLIILIFIMFIITSSTVYADHCTDCYNAGTPCGRCGYGCATDPTLGCVENKSMGSTVNWWSQAGDFWEKGDAGSTSTTLADELSDNVELIYMIGNLVFFAVTVVLGVKYIWGAAEAKASVKDSLITLVVAATFFYGWQFIQSIFLGSDVINPDSFQKTAGNIYNIIIYIANFAAIGGIVYIGVRYLMSGASGRADLKTKSVPVMLGIIMVYCTLGFLNLITGIF